MSKKSIKKRLGSAKVDPNLVTRDGLFSLVENPNFWNYLRNDFVHLGCSCHSQGAQIIASRDSQEKLKKAYDQILDSIDAVFETGFVVQDELSKIKLVDVYAMNLMLDLVCLGKDFISKRTKSFCDKFAIKGTLSGVEIAGEIFSDFNPRQHLRKRFDLIENFQHRREAIWNLQESVFEKSLKIIDIGFQDFVVEPASKAAQTAYRHTPSLAMIALTLGTAQMIMRASDNQNSANNLRDNIGATTEMAAFFILANGILENLSHSLILAAPAYVATGIYDRFYRAIKGEETSQNPATQTHQENPQFNQFGVFRTYDDEIGVLQKMDEYLQQDQLWEGLRKRQLAYEDNPIESQLKQSCAHLISKLKSEKNFGDYYITKKYAQSLADMSLLLNSYQQVYTKKGEDFSIKSDLENFAEVFSMYGVFLKEPSKEAVAAEFCLRAHHQMVNFDERISSSLPHMPSGRQFLLAASVIAAIYSAKEIYSVITGEEETATDYVTNFPDYFFQWLQLDEMYQNIGGGVEFTEIFKEFFSRFNLAENSTHLGITIAPFVSYLQSGSKMFDGLGHRIVNNSAYVIDLFKSYNEAFGKVFSRCFGKESFVPIPSDNYTSVSLREEDSSQNFVLDIYPNEALLGCENPATASETIKMLDNDSSLSRKKSQNASKILDDSGFMVAHIPSDNSSEEETFYDCNDVPDGLFSGEANQDKNEFDDSNISHNQAPSLSTKRAVTEKVAINDLSKRLAIIP